MSNLFVLKDVKVIKYKRIHGDKGAKSGKPYDFTESIVQVENEILKIQDFSGQHVDLTDVIGKSVELEFEVKSGDQDFEPQIRINSVL